jgi:excinuclease ABC subunit A
MSENTKAKNIYIKGARVHNLKNIDVEILRNKLVVITGLSGSGKSSLAYDTLYAEGQRRYVESLSSYARQFLGRMSKPEVDSITGISPAIAIEQKVKTFNPRSTVGTSTEIYDYLKLLFARIGKTYSPVSGKLVKKHSVTDVVDYIISLETGSKVLILSPLILKNGRTLKEQLSILLQQGFSRIIVEDVIYRIDEYELKSKPSKKDKKIFILIDRIVLNEIGPDIIKRFSDSVQTAFYEGDNNCVIDSFDEKSEKSSKIFSNRFEADGISFDEPSVNLFTFNNPYGACKSCEGFGNVIGIDEDLVIPNKSLSVFDEAIVCWKGEKMSEWKDQLVMNAYKFEFPLHRAYFDLSNEEKELLWTGNKYFGGINDFFKFVEKESYKIQYRVMLARYRGKTICPECRGTRIRKEASFVKISEKSIVDIVRLPINELVLFFENLKLNDYDQKVSKRIIDEINNRLKYLQDVGLGYLNLNRTSSTLSGGESQRINLATSLGSSLVGSMYILDEPSIGLHPRDTFRLIKVLKQLRDIGNTVIVVEHDEDIIKNADQIIDIGPLAGTHGGEVVFNGNFKDLLKSKISYTAKYLNHELNIEPPSTRRKWKSFIEVLGASENNLKNVNVKFPLNILTVVTGVSGSGKTSLVKKILYSAIKKIQGGYNEKTGKYLKLEGDLSSVNNIELVDQNPIGRSSRSNPVTYIKAYDEIRTLFSDQKLAKARGYKPGFFSFNIEGGRCEECQGDGVVKIEMQFMADVYLTCESCGGKRFKDEVLDVEYRGKNITDILDFTVEEALSFFNLPGSATAIENRIYNRMKPLFDVGLGYVKLGQPSSTLSGGEAQRLKLASFLTKGGSENNTLFIFDEPTTGLHFHDINKLYQAITALIEIGHTVIIIEHNMQLIKCADWIIDLGPEGGDKGGNIVFEGTPDEIIKCKESYTGNFLKISSEV